jgi:hypothetical protein
MENFDVNKDGLVSKGLLGVVGLMCQSHADENPPISRPSLLAHTRQIDFGEFKMINKMVCMILVACVL